MEYEDGIIGTDVLDMIWSAACVHAYRRDKKLSKKCEKGL